MTDNSALNVDVDSLDPREVLHPPHSWATTKRCIQKACAADEHDWAELTGVEDPPAYWRECRICGIADVTAKAVGQNIKTPNTDQREGAADERAS